MKKKKIVLWNPKPFFEDGKMGLFPPLGLGIIASCTPDHYEVVIRDAEFDKTEYEECDLVGISAMTCQALTGYKIAALFREKKIPVVMGGIHPTMNEEEALQYADVVVKGEAENLWPELLKDFEKGELKKVYHSETFHDLKNLPFPAVEKFNKKYKMGILQTTRGCPFNCEFCAVTTFNGRTYRKRPINEVLDELEQNPNKYIFIGDDNMYGINKKDTERFIQLCQGIIDRKIKKVWSTQVSLNFSDDARAMKIAKKAGCMAVLLGIESMSKDVLTGNMSKRINIKYIEDRNFVKRIHKHGILVLGSFIIGNDEDNEDSYENIYNTMQALKIDIPSVWAMTPYPGTKIYERLKESNRLLYTNYPEDWTHYSKFRLPLFKLKNLDDNSFARKVRLLITKVNSNKNLFIRALRSIFYSRTLFGAYFSVLWGVSARKEGESIVNSE